MQVIIPMAGAGDRFARAGFAELKPLIRVHGKRIIEYVVDLFPGENDFLFIANREHLTDTILAGVLRAKMPTGRIAGIAPHKKGPLATILAAAESIKDDEPAMVNYCDFTMAWDYAGFKRRVLADPEIATAAVCYTGFHPHLLRPNVYAGVLVDNNGLARDIREKHSFAKNMMDGWHQAGTFYFRSGKLLKEYAARALAEEEPTNGEHYVPHAFRVALRHGLKSLVWPLEYFCQWGTPADLREYEAWAGFLAATPAAAPAAAETALARSHDRTLGNLERTHRYWREFFARS